VKSFTGWFGPLLISKFRLSYVHWYTDPETRAANRVFGRMRSMADYRAYTVGLDGRLIGFEPLVCADDAEAIGLSSLSVTGRSSFGTGHASSKLGSNKICSRFPLHLDKTRQLTLTGLSCSLASMSAHRQSPTRRPPSGLRRLSKVPSALCGGCMTAWCDQISTPAENQLRFLFGTHLCP
jgi:hypothetical protein